MWIRSTDVDSDGIVNNSRFFQFFEQARLEHLIVLGAISASPRENGRAFTLAQTTCRFFAPLRHRDRIVVRASTSEVGRTSFVFAYEIRRLDDGSVSASGTSVQVWLGSDGRPTPLPDELRSALMESITTPAESS